MLMTRTQQKTHQTVTKTASQQGMVLPADVATGQQQQQWRGGRGGRLQQRQTKTSRWVQINLLHADCARCIKSQVQVCMLVLGLPAVSCARWHVPVLVTAAPLCAHTIQVMCQ